MFLAFDYPLPISAIGRRSVSTVPSQALMLMNNEFVASQAAVWAERLLKGAASPEKVVDSMFLTAFGRPATKTEIQETLEFVKEQRGKYVTTDAGMSEAQVGQKVWADVAHVLFNSAEFIYVR
jgi:hypothetical protein